MKRWKTQSEPVSRQSPLERISERLALLQDREEEQSNDFITALLLKHMFDDDEGPETSYSANQPLTSALSPSDGARVSESPAKGAVSQ